MANKSEYVQKKPKRKPVGKKDESIEVDAITFVSIYEKETEKGRDVLEFPNAKDIKSSKEEILSDKLDINVTIKAKDMDEKTIISFEEARQKKEKTINYEQAKNNIMQKRKDDGRDIG